MSTRAFFDDALAYAQRDLATGKAQTLAPLAWLDRLLSAATACWVHEPVLGARLWYRLAPGQGARVRAKILTAASGMGIGITDPTMQPGESVADWMRTALRENLRHEHVVPLLRAAARLKPASAADLAARAQ